MTMSLLEREFPTDHLPLLRWLMFTGVSAFGFIVAWYYGLFHLMLATASGAASKSEQNGLGDNEFLPWQLGAVM